jgi:hypothetical protein
LTKTTQNNEEDMPTVSNSVSGDPGSIKKKSWISRSWFSRHWRGELSLGISYWLNGFLANIAVFFVASLVTLTLSDYEPLMGLVGFIFMWGFTLLVIVWQIVGIWRSSDNHVDRGGKKFWSVTAKVMVVLGIVQSYNNFATLAWPQIKEAYRIVDGDPTVGAFNVRILNGGTELEIYGGIPFGSTSELKKFLVAAPTIQVIHLNSHGGRISEAIKMRDLIRERGLTTYTSTKCSSACTIAFVGGIKRFLHPSRGQLGFHQGTFPGLEDDDFRDITNQIISDAVQLGIAKKFMVKGYSTASNSMWYPTKEEIIEANYATGFSEGQFAISGLGMRPDKEKALSLLRAVPLYVAVEKAEPEVFSKIAKVYVDAAIKGLPEGPAVSKIRGMLGTLLVKYLPRASDDALIEMVNVMIEEMRAIRKVDPIACHYFLFSVPEKPITIGLYVDKNLLMRDLKASEMVLISGVKGQVPVFSEEETEPLYDELMQIILDQYGVEVISKLAKFGSEEIKDETCKIAEIMYGKALDMQRINSLKILRSMFSEGA